MATLELTIDQKAKVDLQVTDRAGNPASFDEPPEWESSNPEVLTVEPAQDGMSAWVISSDEVADAIMVTVRGDADLGEGIRDIVGTLQVNTLAGDAQFVELTAGPAEPKDAA